MFLRFSAVALLLSLSVAGCSKENPSSFPEGRIAIPPVQALKMCTDPERWDPKWCQKL